MDIAQSIFRTFGARLIYKHDSSVCRIEYDRERTRDCAANASNRGRAFSSPVATGMSVALRTAAFRTTGHEGLTLCTYSYISLRKHALFTAQLSTLNNRCHRQTITNPKNALCADRFITLHMWTRAVERVEIACIRAHVRACVRILEVRVAYFSSGMAMPGSGGVEERFRTAARLSRRDFRVVVGVEEEAAEDARACVCVVCVRACTYHRLPLVECE